MDAATAAMTIDPRRPEGHFWWAANAGALAGVSNPFTALKLKTPVREALERSLAADPSYLHGAGYCALGKYYNAVPTWFGGNKAKSEQLLRQCLGFGAANTAGHYYLAQTLVAVGRVAEARAELQAALATPVDAEFDAEIRVWKRCSARLLAKLDAAR